MGNEFNLKRVCKRLHLINSLSHQNNNPQILISDNISILKTTKSSFINYEKIAFSNIIFCHSRDDPWYPH